MNLFKTSFYTAIQTVVKLGCGLVAMKIIATTVGPSGVAYFGQFQNFINLILLTCAGVYTSGVVKYTAEYEIEPAWQQRLWGSAVAWGLLSSSIAGLLIYFFTPYLGENIFGTDEYNFIFYVLSVTLICFSLNQLSQAVFNGKKEVRALITGRICSSVIMVVVTVALVYFYELKGALLSVVLTQSIVFPVYLYLLNRRSWFKWSYFIPKYDIEMKKALFGFFIMSLTSSATKPLSMMFVRDYLGTHLGWDAAGLWDGVWRISDLYLMVITTALSVYYLPKLSAAKNREIIKIEVKKVFSFAVPLAAFLAALLFLLKEFVIIILFSKEFMPMKELFQFQLIGSVIKIASWVFGYLLLAKAKTKIFVTSEILFALLFVFLSIVFLDKFGLVGITWAYALNYTIYFLFVYFFVYKKTLAGSI